MFSYCWFIHPALEASQEPNIKTAAVFRILMKLIFGNHLLMIRTVPINVDSN